MTSVRMLRMLWFGMFQTTLSSERARKRPLIRFLKSRWREVLTSGRPCIGTNLESSDSHQAKRFKLKQKNKMRLFKIPWLYSNLQWMNNIKCQTRFTMELLRSSWMSLEIELMLEDLQSYQEPIVSKRLVIIMAEFQVMLILLAMMLPIIKVEEYRSIMKILISQRKRKLDLLQLKKRLLKLK